MDWNVKRQWSMEAVGKYLGVSRDTVQARIEKERNACPENRQAVHSAQMQGGNQMLKVDGAIFDTQNFCLTATQIENVISYLSMSVVR